MSGSRPHTDATALLTSHAAGDSRATAQLIPLVYDRLNRLAAYYMKPERRDHTLEPAALVHEAYLRIIDGKCVDWQGKTHFFAVAAKQMRLVLIDHARARLAQKRKAMLVSLRDVAAPEPEQFVDLLALEEALAGLAQASPRQAQVFELRFYSGLKVNEIAHVLEVSERTVKGDWKIARTWLARELYRRSSASQS